MNQHFAQLSFFRESLTSLQKRALTVAAIILACIAIAYAISRCCLKGRIVDDGKKPDAPQAPLDQPVEENHVLRSDVLAKILRGRLTQTKSIDSAKCFIKLECAKGEIKKEFILKDLANHDSAELQLNKLTEYLETERAKLGACKKGQMLALFKDTQNGFYKEFFEQERVADGVMKGSVSSADDMPNNVIADTYSRVVIKDMGFPKEPQICDGEFVPGSLHVSLI